MRSTLVTGGSGFIGRHVLPGLINAGCDVTVPGRSPRPDWLDPSVHWVECDLTQVEDIRQLFADRAFDTVLHLAWETRHGYFWAAPENLAWLRSSLVLLEEFQRTGGSRFVCAGTCVEYAAPISGPCIAGATDVAPSHLYSVTKDAFHRVLRHIAGASGMTYAWGRVYLLTGPGEASARLLPSVVDQLRAGKPVLCSSGIQVRDFMDTRDCGAAFAAVALSDRSGPIDICTGVPVTIGEVVHALAAEFGRTDLVRLGALPDRPNEPGNLWGSAAALHNEIGFTPEWSLARMLRDAIAREVLP